MKNAVISTCHLWERKEGGEEGRGEESLARSATLSHPETHLSFQEKSGGKSFFLSSLSRGKKSS